MINPHQTKTLTDSKEQTITRGDFFIHGGAAAGSAGCIDLWDKNELFFEEFFRHVEQYKGEIFKNQGKIPLIVKYENSTRVECEDIKLFDRLSLSTKYCKPTD